MRREIEGLIEKEIEEIEEDVFETGCYKKSYRIRRCINEYSHRANRCILWERNVNASMNMINVLSEILSYGDAISYKGKI